MRIRVSGESRVDPEVARKATRFFLSSLLPESVLKSLYVHVKFVKLDERKAECVGQGTKSTLRSFRINVDSDQSERSVISCLAHECVHVKQFAMNELKAWNTTLWKKKPFKDLDLITDSEYLRVPWEREARRLERKLVKEYRCLHLKRT